VVKVTQKAKARITCTLTMVVLKRRWAKILTPRNPSATGRHAVRPWVGLQYLSGVITIYRTIFMSTGLRAVHV